MHFKTKYITTFLLENNYLFILSYCLKNVAMTIGEKHDNITQGGSFWRVKDIMYLVILLFTEDCKLVLSIFLHQKLSCSKIKNGLLRGYSKLRQSIRKMWGWVCISAHRMDLIIVGVLVPFLDIWSAVYVLLPSCDWEGLW